MHCGAQTVCKRRICLVAQDASARFRASAKSWHGCHLDRIKSETSANAHSTQSPLRPQYEKRAIRLPRNTWSSPSGQATGGSHHARPVAPPQRGRGHRLLPPAARPVLPSRTQGLRRVVHSTGHAPTSRRRLRWPQHSRCLDTRAAGARADVILGWLHKPGRRACHAWVAGVACCGRCRFALEPQNGKLWWHDTPDDRDAEYRIAPEGCSRVDRQLRHLV